MVEPEPVSDLVSRNASQVEVFLGTAGKGRVENNDSVIQGVEHGAIRESSVTVEAFTSARAEADAVDVERARISRSKPSLHVGLLGGSLRGLFKPLRFQCPGNIHQLEVETGSRIVVVQDIDLRMDLVISVVDARNQKTGIGRIDPATYGT
jgi:hypothetical protein